MTTIDPDELRRLLDPATPLEERRELILVLAAKAWSAGFDAGVETYRRALVNQAPMSRPEARA